MDVFALKATLGLDSGEYERGLGSAEKQSSTFASVLKANLITKGIEVAIDGFKRLADAASGTVKSIVSAFADNEQLEGGIDTLFKGAADRVKKYADEAYQTAGLSANQYMETVTSFSASLIQALGGNTRQAADMANQAIIDMADNANKMGTDMSAIQNAYQGFAKQNYTMLDNLKLGYGGTKEEAARLIQDAEKLDGTFKATRDSSGELTLSFADMVQAIHIVQDNMGITGTTAKEASETIQGSLAAAKGAWENLLVAMGKGKGIEKALNNFVKAAKNVVKNIAPVVKNALKGLGTMIRQLAPVISQELPGLMADVLPSLLQAVGSLIGSVVQAIPQMLQAAAAALPRAITDLLQNALYSGAKMLNGLFGEDFISREDLGKALQGVQDFVNNVRDAIGGVVQFIQENAGTILPIVSGVVGAIVALGIGQKISGLISNIGNLFAAIAAHPFFAFITVLGGVIGWLINLYNTNDEFRDKVNAAWSAIQGFWESTLEPTFNALKQWLTDNMPAIKEKWDEFKTNVHDAWQAIADYWGPILETAWNLITTWVNENLPGIIEYWQNFAGEVMLAWQSIADFWGPVLETAWNAVSTWVTENLPTLEELWNGFKDAIGTAWEAIQDACGAAWDFIEPILSAIGRGLRNAWRTVGQFKEKFVSAFNGVKSGIENAVNTIKQWIQDVIDAFNNLVGVEGEMNARNGNTSKDEYRWRTTRGFAKGGIIGEGQGGIVGEYRPEYLRVSNGRAIVTPIQGISGRFGGQGGQEIIVPRTDTRPIEITVRLADDTVLGRAIYRMNEAEAQRVGPKLVTGVR